MVKMNIKQSLSRMGYLALRDGKVELNPKGRPEVVDMKSILKDMEQDFALGSFDRPDYFVPFPFLEGLLSFESMRTQGIKIRSLSDRLIYPQYGVFAPTSQDYLDLFSNYLKQAQSVFQQYRTMADLGCGTGILPILAKEVGNFQGKVYAFDKEENCVEAARQNSSIFGITMDKFKGVEIDLQEFYYSTTGEVSQQRSEFFKEICTELQLPLKYDLITCNPPWIPAEHIVDSSPLDNGVYDPKEGFLISSLNFANVHLSQKGEMLLIYSDLAHILGLQDQKRVFQLAQQFNLKAELIDKTSLQANKKANDPLKNVKKEALVQLYRITRA